MLKIFTKPILSSIYVEESKKIDCFGAIYTNAHIYTLRSNIFWGWGDFTTCELRQTLQRNFWKNTELLLPYGSRLMEVVVQRVMSPHNNSFEDIIYAVNLKIRNRTKILSTVIISFYVGFSVVCLKAIKRMLSLLVYKNYMV